MAKIDFEFGIKKGVVKWVVVVVLVDLKFVIDFVCIETRN